MPAQAKLDRAFAALAAAIVAGKIPGAVLGVVDSDGHRAIGAMGAAQLVPEYRPIAAGTWFDLASLTKVLFTTERILALAEAGTIDLDAPITAVLPDFAHHTPDNWQRKVTFRQCLGHQTAFPAVFPLYTYGRDPDLLRTFLLQHDWQAGPSVYSDINYLLLGLALERLERRWIRQMDPGPGFAWSADPQHAAATEDCYWRHRVLVGEVHDDNCAALEGAGHAGLFGTAEAILDFAEQKLRDAGPDALIRMPLSGRRTHGWERPYEGWPGGDRASPETIGHTGFTGTGLWIDFARGHAWTLLTNRVHPTRHFDSGIFALRRTVGDLINRD
ncbi:CubicO group peptidase, beta-lactamase class C family [Devosia crocina]|uniref:CubicO group peptidase, beta-lactamase class C family n=1 Tax=Devosia crocina TaxID=429728 RepID=A0A1I7N2L5_9HYPH|nr:serine hydrolase domain-containing protein [Devosia crocina]SFV28919.1 CubicO group peptidase, beta-lactamase class C family [Devosia crocina]